MSSLYGTRQNFYARNSKRTSIIKTKVRFDEGNSLFPFVTTQGSKKSCQNTQRYPSHQKKKLLNELLRVPIISKTSIILEMKCLMTCSELHYSYLISNKLARQAKVKLRVINQFREYSFQQDKFQFLVETVNSRPNNSMAVADAFDSCLLAYDYPASIKLLLFYFGSFYYSIAGMYQKAQQICDKMYGQLSRVKAEQYFIIYLLLMIKLKTNLSQWAIAIQMILKLLAFSWLYKLTELQIWCYFQLSRAYFFDSDIQKSNFFRKKSQLNIFEPQESIYRSIIVNELKEEIDVIKDKNYRFCYKKLILPSRIAFPPDQVYQLLGTVQQKKQIQNSIKELNQTCRIRHVKNLLPRISHNLLLSNKNNLEGRGVSSETKFSGNPAFMTHLSHIKNLNMYFRHRNNKNNNEEISLYTIQNSSKNWIVLKQMLRNVILEMRFLQKDKQVLVKHLR